MKGKYRKTVDYVFWITFIIFTNPGGILEALGEDSGSGGVNATDFLFVILVGCFLVTFKKTDKENDKTYIKLKKYLFIFIAYFSIVYGFFVPIFRDSQEYTPVFFIIKNRMAFMNITLFVLIYKFYQRSYPIFYKVFIYSSIIIIPLFIISVVTSLDILPVLDVRRNFTILKRKFMVDYGLMPLLIPMGVIILVFKFSVKYRMHIIAGFVLLFLSYVLSITRRYIFGTFIILILGLILNSYILRKPLFSVKGILRAILISGVISYGIFLSFPKYFDAGVLAFNETVNVFRYGKTTTGKKDERLGFNRTFIVDLIEKHPYFGTGFDNRWRTGEGDRQGYEAADYPLLAAIAMTGIFGLLFFLPIYIVLVRALYYDIKFLRKNKYNYQSFEQYILISFILFFIYDLMKYIDWFYGVAKSSDNVWYFMLAFYLASRSVFYSQKSLSS